MFNKDPHLVLLINVPFHLTDSADVRKDENYHYEQFRFLPKDVVLGSQNVSEISLPVVKDLTKKTVYSKIAIVLFQNHTTVFFFFFVASGLKWTNYKRRLTCEGGSWVAAAVVFCF